jgi:hypothetical protein
MRTNPKNVRHHPPARAAFSIIVMSGPGLIMIEVWPANRMAVFDANARCVGWFGDCQ